MNYQKYKQLHEKGLTQPNMPYSNRMTIKELERLLKRIRQERKPVVKEVKRAQVKLSKANRKAKTLFEMETELKDILGMKKSMNCLCLNEKDMRRVCCSAKEKTRNISFSLQVLQRLVCSECELTEEQRKTAYMMSRVKG